ncbi:hypothetical protein CDD81_205 [Ophiocordyceps australis]|uniref:Serine/threonine-protein kinase RIO1 n=1 Tax=Ophiocordyceps australis TaxID=1399860 RepID=A0A2C5YFS0_9HYPO|nr:hypothetical protein CDD81_205 [Ophiocordyceps australis]
MTEIKSPAAPHEPPYAYTASRGYDFGHVPPEVGMPRGTPHAEQDESDDQDVDDIFDEDHGAALDDDDEWTTSARDLTKSYNRQRQLNDSTSGALPRFNQQKPTANTFASVDDQISALSRHAAKIRLDSVKQDEGARDKDKADRATSEQVLDRRTRMILLQLINRNIVSEVHGAISTGKEANVYNAVLYPEASGQDEQQVVQRAIKVYKTSILVFKDRQRYITGEHRFRAGFDKGNNRKMVRLWAEKEFRNLRRIHVAGIPCPEPLALKLHVLVMGLLGDARGWAYPRLRDVELPDDEQWRALYRQLLAVMRKMYQVCRLVHADLSEYNILYNDKTLYIIDVSQSVEPDHPRSHEFLRMDIKNVGDFFRRKGVETPTDRAIFDFVTLSSGPVERPDVDAVIDLLFQDLYQGGAEDDEAAASREIDNEVFRRQYIPQNLEQVYDIEQDTQKVTRGEGAELVYRNLLADEAIDPRGRGQEAQQESDSSDDESGMGAELSGSELGDAEKARPRGKRFEDKEEKRQHKQAVKEAKREKRKEKMPKHVKKKAIASTSRRKK